MPDPLKKYGFINAKLRARLSKILSDDFISQLIRAHSLPETIQLLSGTAYSEIEKVYNNTGDLKMGELQLFKEEVALYTELERYVDKEVLGLIRALTTRFEIDTLKNMIRLWFDKSIRKRDINLPLSYLYREKIHNNIDIDAIINSDTIEGVAGALSTTPYGDIITRQCTAVNQKRSIFPVEIALDHYYYKLILEESKKLSPKDYAIASRLIGVEIDMQNIGWIIRFKTAYNLPLAEALGYCIPYGYNVKQDTIAETYSSENVNELLTGLIKKKYPGFQTLLAKQTHDLYSRLILIERILQQIILKEVQRVLTGYPFTIGIILAYFILKGNEIKKIMTILNAKYYGIQEERIKSGL